MKKPLIALVAVALLGAAAYPVWEYAGVHDLFEPRVVVEVPGPVPVTPGEPVLLDQMVAGTLSRVELVGQGAFVRLHLRFDKDTFARLDPETVFAVLTNGQPNRRILASNVCVPPAPRGLRNAQVVKGYSGQAVAIVANAGMDRLECLAGMASGAAARLAQQIRWLMEDVTRRP